MYPSTSRTVDEAVKCEEPQERLSQLYLHLEPISRSISGMVFFPRAASSLIDTDVPSVLINAPLTSSLYSRCM